MAARRFQSESLRAAGRAGRHAFTLIELIVVMGILVVLAVLTGIGVSQVSREARLSSGVNQVISALGAARSFAIQNNATVMLTFTVNVDPAALGEGEIVEIDLRGRRLIRRVDVGDARRKRSRGELSREWRLRG